MKENSHASITTGLPLIPSQRECPEEWASVIERKTDNLTKASPPRKFALLSDHPEFPRTDSVSIVSIETMDTIDTIGRTDKESIPTLCFVRVHGDCQLGKSIKVIDGATRRLPNQSATNYLKKRKPKVRKTGVRYTVQMTVFT